MDIGRPTERRQAGDNIGTENIKFCKNIKKLRRSPIQDKNARARCRTKEKAIRIHAEPQPCIADEMSWVGTYIECGREEKPPLQALSP